MSYVNVANDQQERLELKQLGKRVKKILSSNKTTAHR